MGAAGEKDKTPDKDAPALDEGIAKVDLAYGLLDFGRKNKTPEALVTAAMILTKIPIVDYSEKEVAKPKLSETQTKEIRAILSEAVDMRPADKVLKELVSRAEEDLKEGSRNFLDNFNRQIQNILRKRIAPRTSTTMATVSRSKGQTISATADNRAVWVGVVNVSTGQTTWGSAPNGQIAVTVPATGTYRVVAYPPGTVAIETGLSLR
jgi:hypothetical protein